MRKDELIYFLESVKFDYGKLLYRISLNQDDGSKNEFRYPWCCQISAHLVTAFLVAHGFECICQYCYIGSINHYWSKYTDLVIDYTFFQFDIFDEKKELFADGSINQQMLEIIKNSQCIYEYDTYRFRPDFINKRIEDNLVALQYAKNYEFTKEDFLRYVEEVLDSVNLNINPLTPF